MEKPTVDYREWGWWERFPSPNPDATGLPVESRSGDLHGYVAIDAEDEDWLGRWKWRLHSQGYVVRGRKIGGRRGELFFILMHRYIMDVPQGCTYEVDHINGVKFDNRKSNLRIVTHAENGQNWGDNPYRGVSLTSRGDKWRARVGDQQIGVYETKDQARSAVKAHREALYPFTNEARHEEIS
jgi:hypothetical protein